MRGPVTVGAFRTGAAIRPRFQTGMTSRDRRVLVHPSPAWDSPPRAGARVPLPGRRRGFGDHGIHYSRGDPCGGAGASYVDLKLPRPLQEFAALTARVSSGCAPDRRPEPRGPSARCGFRARRRAPHAEHHIGTRGRTPQAAAALDAAVRHWYDTAYFAGTAAAALLAIPLLLGIGVLLRAGPRGRDCSESHRVGSMQLPGILWSRRSSRASPDHRLVTSRYAAVPPAIPGSSCWA